MKEVETFVPYCRDILIQHNLSKVSECKTLAVLDSNDKILSSEVSSTARKYQSELREIIDLPFNENLFIWVNEMNLLITNLEHLSAKELLAKVNEIEDIKREICDQTNLVFKNDYNLVIESNLIDQMKDLMRRIIRIDSFIQQSTLKNLTRTYSGCTDQTSEITSLYAENFNYNRF
ncbi:hypothetical protein BpHYR1_038702 [Brachionus plicatilis]|uniref:Uncharacterized protein n=1 Tax=Brachionus plicatilis TaxID=10195 RepID=A0A3M7S9S0_BRAPC|nr:hypothetical protein BpHYR1_038702 [Brachionus plicatilis]